MRTTPAKKPRTECCCQWVARMMAATVAPSGRHSIASTRACFEPARWSGSEVSLGLRLTGPMPLASGLLGRNGDLLAGGDCFRDGRVISSVETRPPPFASGAAIASSVTAMAARPAPVMRRAIAPLSSSRRQAGSEPLALTSSSKPARISLYPVHVMTRKSFGLMTRKLSVTESQKSAQFRGTVSRRKPSVASANWAHVA